MGVGPSTVFAAHRGTVRQIVTAHRARNPRVLGSAIFGPRLAGASAPLVAASRALRQSVGLDE